ncbi:MAG: hypothetical protein EOO78_34890 [Oxalobacteraceae bacterium]|nr:MAG: hypothetical protein EOO78_34890 [Oxalobacteraceae bacterium]
MQVDFGFLANPAGFEIPFRIVPWSASDSYGYALLVASLNTALAAALAIVLASVLGLVIALMRLSANPLAAALARGGTELVRNTPQLLQIVFWYIAVLQVLPAARASLSLGGAVFLSRSAPAWEWRSRSSCPGCCRGRRCCWSPGRSRRW